MFTILLVAGVALLFIRAMLSVVEKLWRPFAKLLRLVCATALVLAIASGLFFIVMGVQEGMWSAAIGGALILFPSLRLFLRLLAIRIGERDLDPGHIPFYLPTLSAEDRHWAEFTSKLRWSQRARAGAAQSSIKAFLAEKTSPSLSVDHRSLVVSLERRAPELLEECLKRCKQASAGERRGYMNRALTTLEQMGLEAERARREVRESDDHELNVLHKYFGQLSERRS